jgi:hypothetical protein
MFAMRLANARDKDIVGAAAGVASEGTLNFVSSLADREAIAFGEAIATPMRMKFGDYRQFESNSDRPADPAPDEARSARLDVRGIIAQMRGEYTSDTPASFRQAL